MISTSLVLCLIGLAIGAALRAWGEHAEAVQLRWTARLLRPPEEDESELDPAIMEILLDRTRVVLSAAKLTRIVALVFLLASAAMLAHGSVVEPLRELVDGAWVPAVSVLFAAFLVIAVCLLVFGIAVHTAQTVTIRMGDALPPWLVDVESALPGHLVAGAMVWENVMGFFDRVMAGAKLERPRAHLYEQDGQIHLRTIDGPEGSSDGARETSAPEAEGDRSEAQMIRAIHRMDRTLVREIMRPINQVTAIRLKDYTPKRFLDLARRTGYTRIPCYEDQVTNLIGYLNVYDLLELGDLPTELRELVTTPLFVPEVARVDGVLREMIARKQQVAIVFDEFGGTSGWLSREDILEEIVGDVGDEYERPRRLIIESRGGYLVDPSVDLDDLYEEVGLKLPKRNCDTIAGYVYARLGRVPRRGETIEEQGWKIRVAAVENHRIRRLRLIPVQAESANGEG